MTFTDHLNKIIKGENLTADAMASMVSDIFSGTITSAQIGAFMAALATKKETAEELYGAALARSMSRPPRPLWLQDAA